MRATDAGDDLLGRACRDRPNGHRCAGEAVGEGASRPACDHEDQVGQDVSGEQRQEREDGGCDGGRVGTLVWVEGGRGVEGSSAGGGCLPPRCPPPGRTTGSGGSRCERAGAAKPRLQLADPPRAGHRRGVGGRRAGKDAPICARLTGPHGGPPLYGRGGRRGSVSTRSRLRVPGRPGGAPPASP
jgi:hypothetical protein